MADARDALSKAGRRGLARHAHQAEAGTSEYLVFMLGDDAYALHLRGIKEIVNPPPITEVPRSPSEIVGVCSVRGTLVTVMDLRRRLRLVEKSLTRHARVLLVPTQALEVVGLLVDQVRQVIRLHEEDIEATGAVLGGELSEHVVGIGRPFGEIVVFLELSSIVGSAARAP